MKPMSIERGEAIRRIMKAVARIAARGSLPVKLENGQSPVVVALPQDSVEHLSEQLVQAGGSANVLVAYPDHFYLVAMAETPSSSDLEEVAEVHHLSDVDMLLQWMKTLPEAGGTFKVNGSPAREHVSPVVKEMEYVF